MGGRVRWLGNEILANLTRATIAAVDDTTAEAAQHAQDHHPWRDETGRLERDINTEPAQLKDGVVSGQWGVGPETPYGIDLEVGTSKMPAQPFLRPAADASYPQLPRNIRKHLR